MNCIVITVIVRNPTVPRDPGPPRVFTEWGTGGIQPWCSGDSQPRAQRRLLSGLRACTESLESTEV